MLLNYRKPSNGDKEPGFYISGGFFGFCLVGWFVLGFFVLFWLLSVPLCPLKAKFETIAKGVVVWGWFFLVVV